MPSLGKGEKSTDSATDVSRHIFSGKGEPEESVYRRDEEALAIPLSLFSRGGSAFQLVVRYLHDVKRLQFKEIAVLLQREYSTIYASYRSCQGDVAISDRSSKILIPITVLQGRALGPLESVVVYLKGLGLRYSEIGCLLGKDERTVWTSYHRAGKKLQRETC